MASTPLVDVKAQYERLIPAIQERIAEVLDSGVFILGPNVQAFEQEAASYLASRTEPMRSCSRSTRSRSARATR